MINLFKSKETRERERQEDKARELKSLSNKLEESVELRSISIQNARYLSSYLKTLDAMFTCAKDSTPKETRALKERIKKRIDKIKEELKEQNFLITHYEESIFETKKNIKQYVN